MTSCDDVLEALALAATPDPAVDRHVAGCPRCRTHAPAMRALAARLAGAPAPAPPATLADDVLRTAAPLLRRHARRSAWMPLVRAIGAALLPLPAILAVDAYLLHTLYTLLCRILPPSVGVYVIVNNVLLLALLLALTYGAIPLLAERQARGRRMVPHG